MLAEWAIFVVIAVSGFFIFHPLKDIAEHVWEIRLLYLGNCARERMIADTAACRRARRLEFRRRNLSLDRVVDWTGATTIGR
jgi:hypothetical protein